METENKYKSTLVVWNGDENPILETFYAGSEEELQTVQEEWMNAGGHKKANMHLYIKTEDEWCSVEQCVFTLTPKLPQFALLSCSPHEDAAIQQQMTYTVIQLNTGRIVRIVPEGYDNNEGIINCELTYNIRKDKDMMCSLAVIKLCDEGLDAIEDGNMNRLQTLLNEDLFKPLAHWYRDYIIATREKNE